MRYGFRNIFRNKVRLLVMAFLLGLPFALLFLMYGIDQGIRQQTAFFKSQVNNSIQVRAKGSMGHVNMVGSDAILPLDAFDKVRAISHVVKVERYLLAMSPTEGYNFGMHVGYFPGEGKRLESHGEVGNPRIVAGRDLEPADQGRFVGLMGSIYARLYGITPDNFKGRKFVIDPKRSNPVIYAIDAPSLEIEIVGLYASGYIFGDMQLFLPIETFKAVYQRDGISWLYVTVDSSEYVGIVKDEIQKRLGDLADIVAPRNVAAFEASTTKKIDQLTLVGFVATMMIACLVLFFTMLFVVRERRREIGTLKAIGASDQDLIKLFLAEAFGYTLMGALVGVLLYQLGKSVLGKIMFQFALASFLPAEYRETLFESLSLPFGLSIAQVLLLAAGSLIVAGLGSLASLWKAIKLSPLEALRNE